MTINYYGLGYVKIVSGDFSLAFNPPQKAPFKAPRFGADLALSSLRLPEYNGVELASLKDKTPFVIDGAGEYEIRGVFVKGVEAAGPAGKINTIYSVWLEGINLCHLGAPASVEFSGEVKEALGEPDVLFVPTYGGETMAESAASRAATSLEAKVVIPLFYDGSKEHLKKFLEEEGMEKIEPQEKLSLKKKDLTGEGSKLVVIKSWA